MKKKNKILEEMTRSLKKRKHRVWKEMNNSYKEGIELRRYDAQFKALKKI